MATKEKPAPKNTVYKIVTEKIIEALDRGVVPWRKPWRGGNLGLNANLNSKRPYTGINQLLLQLLSPYESQWWVTFQGAKRLGGSVKKGERGTLVTFAKKTLVRDRDADDPDQKKAIYMLRYYQVFNTDQCEGLEDALPPEPETMFDPVAKAEELRKDYCLRYGGPEFKHGGMAAYSPPLDSVVVPVRSAFDNAADYYGTSFHELSHSTGHAKRLARPNLINGRFGDDEYSQEELVAEIGSAMLCAIAGLTPDYESSAGYIDHWRSKLEDDPHLIVSAASAAQKSTDWVQGIKPTNDSEEE